MPAPIRLLLEQYVSELKKIYGSHLRSVILYGSYARGDFRADSDIDIMLLLDMDDLALKKYQDQLVSLTADFNMEHEIDIMPIAKSERHFNNWVDEYPFYNNVRREGINLYDAAA